MVQSSINVPQTRHAFFFSITDKIFIDIEKKNTAHSTSDGEIYTWVDCHWVGRLTFAHTALNTVEPVSRPTASQLLLLPGECVCWAWCERYLLMLKSKLPWWKAEESLPLKATIIAIKSCRVNNVVWSGKRHAQAGIGDGRRRNE